MGKFFRALLVIVDYVLITIPFVILCMIGVFLYCVYCGIRYGEWSDIPEAMNLYFKSVKEGFDTNMHYVRTGDHYGTFGIPKDEG